MSDPMKFTSDPIAQICIPCGVFTARVPALIPLDLIAAGFFS